jgi:hypothetical protein
MDKIFEKEKQMLYKRNVMNTCSVNGSASSLVYFFKSHALIDFHFAKPVNDHLCEELVCLCHMSTTIKPVSNTF